MEYKNIESIPLISKSIPNYTLNVPNTINTLKFPNLVTGYKYNALDTSKTAHHTQYTPDDWFQKQLKYYNEADSCRHSSERLRNEALRIIRDAEEKVQSGQDDTDKTIKNIEGPLHIAEECLHHREARKDTELVHDDSEKCLLREIEIIIRNRKQLNAFLDKCKNQVRDCRISQCQLELDLKGKENALGIDTMCHQLNNYSRGLRYYTIIEKNNACFAEQDTWMHATNQIVEKSQTERSKSCQLRLNAEALMIKIMQEMWNAWNDTNNALAHRSSELLGAKNKLEQHLQMVQQEIFDVEKNLQLIRKAIADKNHVLKVAYTRLEARMHRLNIELCRDYAHISLEKEIIEINHQILRMYKTLKELENQHQKLLKTRAILEHDFALKIDAIHIDREKVSGIRRAYPINVLLKF
ncbi:PREDICTED: tektin-3-like [Eufriesea mexicana]|uniref:tektin-3-like n=1 Tax=Eufriesea mexicana TaxID=516756 RepID=UPI00083C1655|nr:PREDICTED: tektin-3-like [Eufriesea mexicana]